MNCGCYLSLDVNNELWFNLVMKTTDAIKTYGGIKEIAKALNISVRAVYKWGEFVPTLRVYQLLELPKGN